MNRSIRTVAAGLLAVAATAVLPLSVFTLSLVGANAARAEHTFTVDSADLVGNTYRLGYCSWLDKYYENQPYDNSATGTEVLSSWQAGTLSNQGVSRTYESYWERSLLYGSGASPQVVWAFDFSSTGLPVYTLNVRSTCTTHSSGNWVNFYVSTDNSSWTRYIEVQYGVVNSDYDYHDLTQYVAGSSKYYIKAELYPAYNSQLFRESLEQYDDHFMSFDNQVTLSPEPGAVIALLGMGLMLGLGVLYRRRRTKS